MREGGDREMKRCGGMCVPRAGNRRLEPLAVAAAVAAGRPAAAIEVPHQ